MGFLESFKESFNKKYEEESERAAIRREHSTYRTIAQQERDRFDSFDNQNDSTLLRKIRNGYLSNEDKVIIDKILRSRGYKKTANGVYQRY